MPQSWKEQRTKSATYLTASVRSRKTLALTLRDKNAFCYCLRPKAKDLQITRVVVITVVLDFSFDLCVIDSCHRASPEIFIISSIDNLSPQIGGSSIGIVIIGIFTYCFEKMKLTTKRPGVFKKSKVNEGSVK